METGIVKRALRASARAAVGAIVLSFGPAAAAASEGRVAKNSVYAEGLGPGGAYSINYERMVHEDVGVRAGLSYMSWSASAGSSEASASMFSLPITASYIGVSAGSHALEIGGGATLFYATGSSSSLGLSTSGSGVAGYGTALLGYRIQPRDGGFQFRVGLATLFGPGLSLSSSDPDKWGALPWGYISFGGTF